MSRFLLKRHNLRLVTPPTGWTWTLPFSIYQRGRVFSITPSFNLQSYANITVSKTYYVDKATGNDAATGADWAHALATLTGVQAKGDADRVYVRDSYFYKSERNIWGRSVEIIGSGSVYLTSDVANVTGTFSAVDSHYVADLTQYVATAYDDSNLDALGHPTLLTAKASIAQVDAAANSVYVDWPGRKIYVRMFDDRAPDASLHLYDSTCYNMIQDNVTYYLENINFRGGVAIANNSATGGAHAYFKNCTAHTITISGADEAILQGCTLFGAAGDALNYASKNGVVPQVIEIDCEPHDNGSGSTDQNSTAHNGMSMLRINGEYHHSAGQNIADVDANAKTWMLGCELYNSTSGVGFYLGGNGSKAWLDCVTIHDNATNDLQNEVGSTIYTRNLVSGGNNSISGTLATY